MSASRPLQNPSGSFRRITILLALGFCAYAVGLLVGHHWNRALVGHLDAGAPAQAAFAPENASPILRSPSNDTNRAVASPFFPDLTNAMQAFTEKARLFDASSKGKDEVQLFLAPLMRLLSTNDYPEAWAFVRDLRSAGPRNEIQWCLLRLWARADPLAALKAVQTLPQISLTDRRINEVLSVWAEHQPQAALDWVQQTVPDEHRNAALKAIAEGMASQNPKAAAKLLASLPGTSQKWVSAMDIMSKLAPADPDAALGFLDQTGLAEYRDDGFAYIAEVKAAQSVPDTLSWAQTLSSTKDQETVKRAVISRLALTQPEQAVDLLMSQTDGKQRAELAGPLAETWAKSDPQAVSAWVSQLPDGPLRQEASSGLERSWARQDPEAAANFFLNSLPRNEATASLLASVASAWSWRAINSQDALAWADRLLAGVDRDAFLSGICRGVSFDEPEQAANLATTIAPGKTQSEAIEKVARSWVFSNGDAPGAAAWGAGLPEGPARTVALSAICEHWSSLDPAASAQWLESLPPDDARAKAAAVFVERTASLRPDLAALWVNSISDDAKRNQQIEQIARAWSKTAPDAAQAWLVQTTLPADRKEQVLKK